jgi:hypothetical protein
MKGCNPVDTPMEQHSKLLPGKSDLVLDATKYKSVVSSLRYLVNTRPNLVYSMGIVSMFMETPNVEHWTTYKRIVRYVASTSIWLQLKGESSELLGYSDSDHAGDLEKRTTSVVFFLGRNIITWTTQKQRMVSLSSFESEYIATATATYQGLW